MTKREQKFYEYGKDIEFVRHHKRTVRNFKEKIQEIIDSSKQTVKRGIITNFAVAINYL